MPLCADVLLLLEKVTSITHPPYKPTVKSFNKLFALLSPILKAARFRGRLKLFQTENWEFKFPVTAAPSLLSVYSCFPVKYRRLPTSNIRAESGDTELVSID